MIADLRKRLTKLRQVAPRHTPDYWVNICSSIETAPPPVRSRYEYNAIVRAYRSERDKANTPTMKTYLLAELVASNLGKFR